MACSWAMARLCLSEEEGGVFWLQDQRIPKKNLDPKFGGGKIKFESAAPLRDPPSKLFGGGPQVREKGHGGVAIKCP